MKRNTIKESKHFEKHVTNLCNAFCCGSHDQEFRTIFDFTHNRGFTITLHKDDQKIMFSVYCKFNTVHPEIKESNQFSGKYNFLTTSKLNEAKKEFENHFKELLNIY